MTTRLRQIEARANTASISKLLQVSCRTHRSNSKAYLAPISDAIAARNAIFICDFPGSQEQVKGIFRNRNKQISVIIMASNANANRCPTVCREGQSVRHANAVANQTGATASRYIARRAAAMLSNLLSSPTARKIQFALRSKGIPNA